MIRCLYPAPIPESSWLRFVLHPDPDYIAVLAARFAQVGSHSGDDRQSGDFSQVVSSIRVGRTHKLTRPNRLRATTQALYDQLARSGRESVDFLDVGASDGITSLETLRMLRTELRVPVRMCLLDPFVRLLRYRAGVIVEYRTPNQSPVMVRVGPIGLQLSSLGTSRDPLSRWLGGWYSKWTTLRQGMRLDETISLINPVVATEPAISVLEWDVLCHNPGLSERFDVARASNVLNYAYFSREQIEKAVSHLHMYLRPNGLLLISRSLSSGKTEVDNGSIWRKDEDRFIHLRSVGSGAEVREQVEQYRTKALPVRST
jgi:hypothetical protein